MDKKLSRNIIDAIITNRDECAKDLFEMALAQNITEQLSDIKTVFSEKIFEENEVDKEFMPIKRNFSIETIDHEGKPVKFSEVAYTASTAAKKATDKGHKIVKVVDAAGHDVTADACKSCESSLDEATAGKMKEIEELEQAEYNARKQLKDALKKGASKREIAQLRTNAALASRDFESLLDKHMPQKLDESLRLISSHGDGKHTAKVYKDADWGEYRVKFFKDGKHVGEDGDYHTDDIDDAKSTADTQIKRYNLNEDTAIGNVNSQLTADSIEQKKQEDAENAKSMGQQKSPTVDDVMSVLGNTVSVIDTKTAQ